MANTQLAALIRAKILSVLPALAQTEAGGAQSTPVGSAIHLEKPGAGHTTSSALASVLATEIAAMFGGTVKCVAGCTGADVDTNIAVTGIATTDELIMVVGDTGGTPTDVTSEAAITSAGNIQCTTTDHTGKTLDVYFVDANGSEL